MRQFDMSFYDTLPSTQQLMRERASENAARPGSGVWTTLQTAGVARRGRVWDMPRGNLAVTWAEKYDASHINWLPFAVSLGLFDAARSLLGGAGDLALKWPNDVLLDGGKLSGILIEVAENNTLLIGVGVNVAHAPKIDQKTACLADYAPRAQAKEFLELFLSYYDVWHTRAAQGGFSALRHAWLGRAVSVGGTITARFADGRSVTGVFTDLDPSGALLLNASDGVHKITAADIFIQRTS
jgi:BirA family biotin operon repressor/biotin-[acetyl-CoA-carboxylase] ligase